MKINDLEEYIMKMYNIPDDLRAILKFTDELDLSPDQLDKLQNLLVGVAELADLRADALFDAFEKVLMG